MTSPLRRRVVALGAATAALLTAAGAAGATPMLEAVRVASRPVIDGALDDGAWTEVAVGRDFHVRYPADDGVPTEPTEVRVVYDQDAVYVGITAHDAHPDQIRALLTRRDEDSTSDWLSVGIDSLGDRRTSFVFAISAAGVQRDYKIVDDRQVDDGWDAVWESAVRRGDDGWTAELRIPLSQLRFAARDQEWGMQVTRVLARTGEESVWSPSPHTDRRLVSRYGRLAGLRALRAPRDLELRPYAVLGGELRDVDPALRDDLGPRWSVGADARYGLGAGLVLTAAINPDFGQVEADPSEINLTDSELFFPERRALFQEAAELFDATLAGDETLFYSRRIGAAPHGEPGPDAVAAEAPDASTILGAAKLSGRTASGWSIGVLDAVGAPERARVVREDGSRGEDPVEPLTNFGVVRVRKTLGREDTTLGGIVTTVHRRLDDPAFELLHRDAYVAGVDGAVGFGDGSWRLSGLVAGTRVAGSAAAIARTQRSSVRYWQRPDATHVAVDPARTALLGWGGTLALEHSGAGGWSGELRSQLSSPGFEPNDLGFLQLADAATHALTVRWDGGGDGAISAYTLSGTVQAIHDFEPRLHAWTAGGEADVTFANLWQASLGLDTFVGRWDRNITRGGPLLRVDPTYYLSAAVQTDPRRHVRGFLGAYASQTPAVDGWSYTLAPSLSATPTSNLRLELGGRVAMRDEPLQYVDTVTDAGGVAHVVIGRLDQVTAALTVRADYTWSPRVSLQVYARPYLTSGRFGDYREVADAHAPDVADRFAAIGPAEVAAGSVVEVDRDGDGVVDYDFVDPSFDWGSLQSTVVLRWEYRPGSSLFLIWSHARDAFGADGVFELGPDLGDLAAQRGEHVVLVKADYWMDF